MPPFITIVSFLERPFECGQALEWLSYIVWGNKGMGLCIRRGIGRVWTRSVSRANWLRHRYSLERVLRGYRDGGFAVHTVQDIHALPRRVVEAQVSQLRDYWRRWLYGESVAMAIFGPAGIVVGGPMLFSVVLAWSIEMGWAYGLDMSDPLRVDHLRRSLYECFLRVLGISYDRSQAGWTKFFRTAVFWGFGPEFEAADAVMAEMRRNFSREWEQQALRSQIDRGHSGEKTNHSRLIPDPELHLPYNKGIAK